MKAPTHPLLVLLVFLVLLAACGDGGAPTPSTLAPGDDATTAPGVPEGWERAGLAGIDATGIEVLEEEARLTVSGSLPTPCHVPVWEVAQEEETLEVELYSAVDPGEMCAQVLEPFEVSIPLGSFDGGTYTVTLNGERVGGFTA